MQTNSVRSHDDDADHGYFRDRYEDQAGDASYGVGLRRSHRPHIDLIIVFHEQQLFIIVVN